MKTRSITDQFEQQVEVIDIFNRDMLVKLEKNKAADSYLIYENFHIKDNILYCDNIVWQDLEGMNYYEAQNYFNTFYHKTENLRYMPASYFED